MHSRRRGWFLDSTPHNDSEFTRAGNKGEQNRMDLLTVRGTDIMPPILPGYDQALEQGFPLPDAWLDAYFSALSLGAFKAGG